MDEKNRGTVYKRMVGTLCLCVLGIILTAGLWPFHVPSNQVRWIESANGLEFGRHGSVVSVNAFRGGDPAGASGTLEIWLEPSRGGSSGTILSFDESAHPGEPFSLLQEGDDLGIRRNNVDPQGISRTALFYVKGALQDRKPIFVTIALDSREVLVYINGVLKIVFPHSLAWNDLSGHLVLANSPTANDSWAGKIFALAIYRQQLTPSQIATNYTSSIGKQTLVQANERSAEVLYLFDEHGGTIVHNRLDPALDLTIPKHYFVLHPGFLRTPWREYHPTWSYWQDAGVNIVGFVPFGFCVFAYLSLTRAIKYPGATTVAVGLFTSLTIEVLQAYLPTRSSGVTDLITNTLGTAIGVMIFQRSIVQTLLAKSGEVIRNLALVDTATQQ
jgi:VanZ family protein